MIEHHAGHLADQIEADHVYTKVRVKGRLFRQWVCTLCRQPAPCAARVRAVDLRAGRVDPTGRPVARIPRQRKPVRAATWVDF